MSNESILFTKDLNELKVESLERKSVTFSPSAIITFDECPHKWRLTYLLKKSKFETSIDLLFGIAAHEAVQNAFLKRDMSLAYDFFDIFKKKIEEKKSELKEKDFNKIEELLVDAHNIFDNFELKVDFDNIEDIKVEEKLFGRIKDYWNFSGRLDLMLKAKGKEKYKIIDIKTTKRSWDISKLNNVATISQLVLYKSFVCAMKNIPTRDVSVAFLFLKKKSTKPVDLHTIGSGPKTIEKCTNNMNNSIKLIESGKFFKSHDKRVCKWCEFDNTEFCFGDKSF